MSWLNIIIIGVYCIISCVALVEGCYGVQREECDITLGSLLFPAYFLPFIIWIIFTVKISTLWYLIFDKKEYCRCPTCGSAHLKFSTRINKKLGL